jgi:hypothetical protein
MTEEKSTDAKPKLMFGARNTSPPTTLAPTATTVPKSAQSQPGKVYFAFMMAQSSGRAGGNFKFGTDSLRAPPTAPDTAPAKKPGE